MKNLLKRVGKSCLIPLMFVAITLGSSACESRPDPSRPRLIGTIISGSEVYEVHGTSGLLGGGIASSYRFLIDSKYGKKLVYIYNSVGPNPYVNKEYIDLKIDSTKKQGIELELLFTKELEDKVISVAADGVTIWDQEDKISPNPLAY